MEETPQTEAERILKIGPDRVTVRKTEVVIEAKRPMADWKVLDLNPVPIYFENNKYQLIEVRKAEPPLQVRYLLHPWPEGHVSSTKLFHSYDAEAVAEREGGQRSENMDEAIRWCLLPFYPFLGLLWSGVQRRLVRFGFVPHLISGISVFTCFALLFAQGSFIGILLNASARSGKLQVGGILRALASSDYLHIGPLAIPIGVLDGVMLLALLADVLVRYSHYLREDQWAGGFLEWIVRGAGKLE